MTASPYPMGEPRCTVVGGSAFCVPAYMPSSGFSSGALSGVLSPRSAPRPIGALGRQRKVERGIIAGIAGEFRTSTKWVVDVRYDGSPRCWFKAYGHSHEARQQAPSLAVFGQRVSLNPGLQGPQSLLKQPRAGLAAGPNQGGTSSFHPIAGRTSSGHGRR